MPSEREFNLALDEIANYVRDIENKVIEENVEELVVYEDRNEEEYNFSGHRCAHDESVYIVAGHPDFRFMSVVYFASITEYIARGLSEEKATEILEVEPNGDFDILGAAAHELLKNVDDGLMNALNSYLYTMASGSSHITEVKTLNDGTISYIALESKIFPYDSNFNISEFNEKVVSIVGAGEQINKLLPRTIGLSEPDEDSDKFELEINLNW